MPKTHSNSTRIESAQDIRVPKRPNELASMEPILTGIAELAARRDALRLMAERATDEADRLQREITKAIEGYASELNLLTVQIRYEPSERA